MACGSPSGPVATLTRSSIASPSGARHMMRGPSSSVTSAIA